MKWSVASIFSNKNNFIGYNRRVCLLTTLHSSFYVLPASRSIPTTFTLSLGPHARSLPDYDSTTISPFECGVSSKSINDPAGRQTTMYQHFFRRYKHEGPQSHSGAFQTHNERNWLLWISHRFVERFRSVFKRILIEAYEWIKGDS